MCFSEEEDGLPLEAVVVMVELKVRLKNVCLLLDFFCCFAGQWRLLSFVTLTL